MNHFFLAALWIACVVTLLAGVLTKNKNVESWGDALLCVSYGTSAIVVFVAGRYWIAAAFLFPCIRQAYVLLKDSRKVQTK